MLLNDLNGSVGPKWCEIKRDKTEKNENDLKRWEAYKKGAQFFLKGEPERIYVTRCLGFNGALVRLSRATLQQYVLEPSKILLQYVLCSSV